MKFQKIIFTLVLAAFAFTGCKQEVKKQEVAISISGMTCEIGCAKLIESKLNKQEGVLEANVVFNDSIANVKFDPSKTNKASLIAFVGGIAGNMYKATETTAKKTCSADCKKACCETKEAKTCAADCKKDCCAKKEAKACAADCKKDCCAKKEGKVCTTDCKKECCAKKEAKACAADCKKENCTDKKA